MKKPSVKPATPRIRPPAARLKSKPASKPAALATAAPALAIGPRLRHARLVKGLLIKELAQKVGVSISLISKYENDKLLPPLTVLHRLVTQLETNIGALFEPNRSGADYIAHAGSRPRISAGGGARLAGGVAGGVAGGLAGRLAGVTLERLVPNGQGHLLQGNIHIVAPGGGSMGPIQHAGDEVGYVLEGRLSLCLDDTTYELMPGDSFAFPSNLAHTYRNPGPDVTRVIWINTPPTF